MKIEELTGIKESDRLKKVQAYTIAREKELEERAEQFAERYFVEIDSFFFNQIHLLDIPTLKKQCSLGYISLRYIIKPEVSFIAPNDVRFGSDLSRKIKEKFITHFEIDNTEEEKFLCVFNSKDAISIELKVGLNFFNAGEPLEERFNIFTS
jgi:flagellar assembly factor FliW